VDLDDDSGCLVEICFADTVAGQWLASNAWQYGYILRYPNGATAITGYQYEPWHYRYVGTTVSTAMHNQGTGTLEEYFGLEAAPSYY
jgi:D-alanyl-D-alanine carboxypeptidase